MRENRCLLRSCAFASAVEEQTVTTNEMVRNVMQAAKGSTEIVGNIVNVADVAKRTTESSTSGL